MSAWNPNKSHNPEAVVRNQATASTALQSALNGQIISILEPLTPRERLNVLASLMVSTARVEANTEAEARKRFMTMLSLSFYGYELMAQKDPMPPGDLESVMWPEGLGEALIRAAKG